MSASLAPGFSDPVADAQACFRAVLDAMAHPGRVNRMHFVQAPAPLCAAAAAALLTLLDHESPLWLDPEAAAARDWITFHTGAPLTVAQAAAYALAMSLPDLTALAAGSDEAPETSTTLILQVSTLSAGARFVLSGPGLREPEVLTVDGLPPDFAALWAANHALFPRGVDLMLCAGNDVAALPRSVTVKDA